jgi:predicted transcriptional regulator
MVTQSVTLIKPVISKVQSLALASDMPRPWVQSTALEKKKKKAQSQNIFSLNIYNFKWTH